MGEGEVVKEVRGQEDRPLARRVLENADTKEKKKEKETLPKTPSFVIQFTRYFVLRRMHCTVHHVGEEGVGKWRNPKESIFSQGPCMKFMMFRPPWPGASER